MMIPLSLINIMREGVVKESDEQQLQNLQNMLDWFDKYLMGNKIFTKSFMERVTNDIMELKSVIKREISFIEWVRSKT